ncbi:MAG: winged helix DNA-binding domain-containing protein [Ancrocorticia sp.]
MVEKVSRGEVIAFRLGAHGLLARAAISELPDVVGRCGIQNSPPGSALLALHARVQGVTPELLDAALAKEKSLIQTWCMRGAPYFIPTADAAIFTTGVLPPTEASMRHLLLGVGPDVDRLDMSLTEAVELVRAEIRDVLSGRRLAINELGAELAERIVQILPGKQCDLWKEEGPHAKGQPLGEAVVHFCIRILTLQGVVCFAPREGNKAPFVLTDEWLGHPIPSIDPDTARVELLRRFLHCYGPSTRAAFAAWLGVRSGDVDPWWSLIEDELTLVDYGGREWMLDADVDALRAGVIPEGVRLLPPRDPYTQLRDRETIVAKKYHRDVWRTSGDPGTLLADGEIVGVWRPRKSGRKLTITVKTFRTLAERHRVAVRTEAEQVAALRGASSVTVEFETY